MMWLTTIIQRTTWKVAPFLLVLCGMHRDSPMFGVHCLSSQIPSRRHLVNGLFKVGVGYLCFPPCELESAHAARGAFELDAEYYMRDLLGGNKKEGNVLPSTPPTVAPPRLLQGPLLPLLLNNDYSPNCIPVKAMVQQITKQDAIDLKVAKLVADKASDYRTKASRSFYNRAEWKEEDVSDQYYFDLSSYALWRAAADLLDDNVERDQFARRVGRLLYEKIHTQQQQQQQQQAPLSERGSLVASEPAVVRVLELFRSSNFCKNYRIGNDLSVPERKKGNIEFDEFDDDAIQSGASVDCLISVYEPAVLGANLQITGEQSRFSPDYVGSTLAALWESVGIKSSWEVFFVDPEYRPNPKDYYPNEKLLQFTLTL